MKLKTLILFVICIAAVTCENKKSDESMISEMSGQRGYQNWYLDSFRCGLFVPPSYDAQKKYPLVIFLHGYSDTTTWNLGWYNEPILSSDPCIVLTPKCPIQERGGWGNSWDPQTSPMMKKTYEMLELVKEAFNLDTDRFYICGSSMGGFGTFGAIKKIRIYLRQHMLNVPTVIQIWRRSWLIFHYGCFMDQWIPLYQ